jgi:hypothetical protein
MALAVSSGHAYAQSSLYPACINTGSSGCTMTDNGNGPVMHGNEGIVSIYIIFYGPFAGPINQTLATMVPLMINDLSDSVYEATAATYYDSTGPTSILLNVGGTYRDTDKSMGNSLNDAQIQQEIANLIQGRLLPADPNGIYLVLPDDTISLTTKCGGYCSQQCGCNSNSTIEYFSNLETVQMNLEYAVVGDPLTPGCSGGGPRICNWGFQTPNGGSIGDTTGIIDGELENIAHELNELLTDPEGLSAGWYNVPTNNQMADFCVGQEATAEGTTYFMSSLDAPANFQGRSGETYLLQTLRANDNAGYCVNTYGGVYWGQNFGWSHSPTNPPDWQSGSFKGECPLFQPINGVSKSVSTETPPPVNGPAHAITCGSAPNFEDFSETNCEPLVFEGTSIQWYVDPAPLVDWDPNFFKGECGQNQYAAGVSQSTSGVTNGLLCCGGNVTHASCQARPFDSSNVTSYDWDDNFLKAQCSFGQYVAGISADTVSGAPHKILCCSP